MATKKNTTTEEQARDEFDQLMNQMSDVKKQWDNEQHDDEEDETGHLLNQAIELALEQGRGWSPGEKEQYLKSINNDDSILPLFARTADEVEQSGLAEAFTSLKYDDTPTQLMLNFKKMGNDAFANGKRNVTNNVQYFRDAVNHYYEAIAWADKIEPMLPGDWKAADNDDPTYTVQELNAIKATLCCNAALAHTQLKNWGLVRDTAQKAISYDSTNVKAWFRLAKAHQMLHNWEEAGNAIDHGLELPGQLNNIDLKQLQSQVSAKVFQARRLRQERERARALRVSRVKQVWKHCQDFGIQLGRLPLVATVTDDEDGTEDESKWHHHRPHSGSLPESTKYNGWTWPCMFLYPSHNQSDFVKQFAESDMLALIMAGMFPESEDMIGEQQQEAEPPSWDYNHEFVCSNLAVYCEVHCSDNDGDDSLIHPEYVSKLKDQGEAMRLYEATRALRGDEGTEMLNLVQAVERKKLYQQRKAWQKKHGSLWSTPGPCPVVEIHPAVTLGDVLADKRIVVPNFLVTFILFPDNHPAHEAFLKERKCMGVIQPKNLGLGSMGPTSE